MAASAADGLDGRARVELERVSKLPNDEEAIHRADVAKADTVIEVSWPDADGRRAHLHAHLKPKSPWIDRDLTFEATSKPWERGRAIGLAVAAMLPDESAAAPVPVPVPVPEPEPVPEPVPVPDYFFLIRATASASSARADGENHESSQRSSSAVRVEWIRSSAGACSAALICA